MQRLTSRVYGSVPLQTTSMPGDAPHLDQQTPDPAMLVLTTAANQVEAERIAHLLVEQRLAACVNLVPAVQSVYRWQGAVETASEILLVIKTVASRLDTLEKTILANHSYQVPEFLALPIHSGSRPYLDWLSGSLR
jgi:periplasmic divalent cation tolerance protein